ARRLWEERNWPLPELDRLARPSRISGLCFQLDEEVERLFARPYERKAHVFGHDEAEDPAARDALRVALRDVRALARLAAALALPLRDARPERERYLFYACASRAERLLALSWRETDEEGEPQVRSFLVYDVRDAVDAEVLDRTLRARPLAQVAWPADHAPTEAEWRRAMAAAGPDVLPPRPERIESGEVLADLAARDRLSAAALEAYADCPVKWLVERLLDPEALEPDPEPLVRGRYAHAVLELTYRRLRERTGSRRVTPDNLPEAEAILVEALRERE